MKRYLCWWLSPFLFAGCFPTETTCAESATCGPPSVDGGTDAQPDVDTDDSGASDVGPTRDGALDGVADRRSDAGDAPGDRINGDSPNDAPSDMGKVDGLADGPDLSDSVVSTDANDAADVNICDPTKRPSEDVCVIDEMYAVFVSPAGDDAGAGTRVAPFKTLSKALTTAGSMKRVYACDTGVGYAEQVTLTSGAKLFGGFSCVDWSYLTTRRAVVKSPTSPALTVQSGSGGALVEDVEFDAPDAVTAGGSSIAAIVDTSTNVVLRRVKLVAGKGADGANGADGAKGDNGVVSGAEQVGKDATCGADAGGVQSGGTGSSASTCGSTGGNGGQANRGNMGSAGVAGIPLGAANGGPIGMDGLKGSDGAIGSHGASAAPTGTFSASGFVPPSAGGDGTVGTVGQGGGGGGASSATGSCLGASGGAGGMGGCGGKLGTGGSGGGASVAILSWTSAVVLDACVLIASNGGAGGKGGSGGDGGIGQAGASGGAGIGSSGIAKGGDGGKGGNGGPGGSGAGGSGGPSHARVFKGTAPQKMNGTTVAITIGGAAGVGGTNGTKAPDGTPGAAADDFTIP